MGMTYEDEGNKVKDIRIACRYWTTGKRVRGHSPSMTISFETLMAILGREDGPIDPEDAVGVVRAFARYARNSGNSESAALEEWHNKVAAQEHEAARDESIDERVSPAQRRAVKKAIGFLVEDLHIVGCQDEYKDVDDSTLSEAIERNEIKRRRLINEHKRTYALEKMKIALAARRATLAAIS